MLIRLTIARVGVFAVMFGAQYVASEWGEVVVLTTVADGGELRHTRLWIVDLDDRSWRRAGTPQSAWLVRLRANPRIILQRHGSTDAYVALPQPAMRLEINQLMSRQYGCADGHIGFALG